ncbi:MAG: carboxypeptidase-like regulatory domain-containing protein [Bacteroidia bacterium]
MKFFLSLCGALIFNISAIYAQNGSIKGSVKDDTKLPLIGVNVIIKGTNIGASTDFDGNYSITNVKPGTYTLFVSYISYKAQEIMVEVLPGKTAMVNITLLEDVAELAAVEIQAERITYTEAAVLMEVRESKQVVSGVSSQEISRSPDKDAAQVASRVPGVTIVDNSFVMIRGLGQRYNNVMLNGISAPSTEPDSRAFSFDLIPSAVMDRMLIYKSGAADMPGDFAGGVIKVYTKAAPDYDLTEVNVGLGYRHGTSLNTYQVNRAGSLDFLGFDRGRGLPSDFPSNLGDVSGPELEQAGRSLRNNFQLNDELTMLDFKMGINYGRNFKLFGKKAANLTSVNYSQSQQHLEVERNRWTADREMMFDFLDQQIETEVRLGLVSNWSLAANKRNKYSWKNTFNQIGERSTIIRTGIEPQQRLTDLYRNYSFQYLARSIFTTQIEGEHLSADKKSKFVWIAGGAVVNRNEPDFRRVRTTRPIDDQDAPFTIIDPPGATTFDNARFYSRLNEVGASNSLAFEHVLGDVEKKNNVVLKAGTYFDYRYRTFEARWMSYVYPGFGDTDEKTHLVQLPIDEVFDPMNVARNDGWRLVEGTNPSDRYDANTLLGATYVGADIPLGERYNLSAGFRFEYFRQVLNSATQTEPVNVNNVYQTPMPFANFSYTINAKSLLRLAYGRTVNRPELRELAPFLYYNFKYDVNFVGEPNLVQAEIHNVDLRWEFYPQNNETFSVGVFYKNFSNPIETYVQTVGLSQQFKLGNAASAENFGVEMELRKSLGDVASKSMLSRFFLVANASYIYTIVDLGDPTNLAQDQIRPLQGQSPYVINAGLHYRHDESGNSMSVLYNVAGPRIFFVGNDQFPTVFEMPRHMLDLVYTKRMNARMDVKFGISNILNARTLLVQDTNRDNKIDFKYGEGPDVNPDDLIMHFRRGVMWSGQLVFRL